ncbi:MAG: HAD hydrolase-like protein [Clostridia bacterium]|nr:HAD hydrolase-like protein [Clostridia bacterium]
MTDRFDKFSALIFDVSRNWHKIASDEMAKYDLKGTYIVYLSAMARCPEGITAAKLAEICCRDKADVSRAISAMEEKGMVEKLSARNNSYRAALKLTDKGIRIAKELEIRGEAAINMAGMGIAADERTVFYKVMETIAENLRCMSCCGVPDKPIRIKAVLFDLDGTLLPMDQDEFIRAYMTELCKKLTPLGYDSEELKNTLWHGIRAMYRNKGKYTNEAAFWHCFKKHFPEMSEETHKYTEDFYLNDFDRVSSVAKPNPDAKKAYEYIKSIGMRVALATNPLFPRIATEKRIKWAGFDSCDFEFITSYEDSYYTKPNAEYYRGIYERMGLKPCECLVVGNDVDEDLAAKELGMRVFLLTDCMINRHNRDISVFPHGNFNNLIEYIKEQV